jgi:MscS family membrane protein
MLGSVDHGRAPGQWLQEHLPESLLATGPQGLLWWQWIALPVLVLAAFVVALGLSRLSRAVLSRLAARTSHGWDDSLLQRMRGPITLAWMLALLAPSLPFLGLVGGAQAFVRGLVRGGFFLVFFWVLYRATDVVADILLRTRWAVTRPASRSLVPLGRRVGKVLVMAMATIAVLSELGYPVASLVAGLGIGGLAFALAAQKTIENVFGAFSIGVDQPFREGDTVRIEDVVGTVEAIGLRSTRIRTLDRTLITIPNGKLADMNVESYTVRDRMRLFTTIPLVFGTRTVQMRQVLTGIEEVLRAHPKLWPDELIVRFKALGASSLNIEVMAWFLAANWTEFQLIRQEMLLAILEVVEASGAQLALPTQTLHLASAEPAGAPPERQADPQPARPPDLPAARPAE